MQSLIAPETSAQAPRKRRERITMSLVRVMPPPQIPKALKQRLKCGRRWPRLHCSSSRRSGPSPAKFLSTPTAQSHPLRFTGTLRSWDDDRGFGFIAPTQGRSELFVHISAFPRDGSRPTLGEKLNYEPGRSDTGKPQAPRSAARRSPRQSHETLWHANRRNRIEASWVNVALPLDSIPVLIGKELQPQALRARSTLTPTLSRQREREHAGALSHKRKREHAGSLDRVLVGEGWGEGRPADWLNIVANQAPLGRARDVCRRPGGALQFGRRHDDGRWRGRICVHAPQAANDSKRSARTPGSEGGPYHRQRPGRPRVLPLRREHSRFANDFLGRSEVLREALPGHEDGRERRWCSLRAAVVHASVRQLTARVHAHTPIR